MKEYAVYQGEEIIAIGTAKEVAAELNIKVETVWFYATPTYKKRLKKPKKPRNQRVVVVLGDDD